MRWLTLFKIGFLKRFWWYLQNLFLSCHASEEYQSVSKIKQRLFKTWRLEKSPTLFARLQVSEQRSRILGARWLSWSWSSLRWWWRQPLPTTWRCLRWTPRLRRWPEIAGTIFSSMVSRFKRVHRRHHCCHHNHLARHSHIHLFWSNSIMIGECMESLANIMADIVRTRLGVRRWSRTGCGKENERRRKNS